MCACCQVDCCILEQSLFFIKDGKKKQKKGMKEKDPDMEAIGQEIEAEGRATEADIRRWVVTGVDNSTFLECTNCHWWVCPRCVGICVEPLCRDTQCKRCLEAQVSASKAPSVSEGQDAGPTNRVWLKGQYPEYKGRDPFGKCEIHD